MYYDKDKLKELLDTENIYDLLVEFGGEPERTDFGLISSTICHNLPGEGSRKLYYYDNNGIGLFHCYTGCLDPSFDVFQLVIKVMKIQHHKDFELYDAMDYVANYFGLAGEDRSEGLAPQSKDWDIFQRRAELLEKINKDKRPRPQLKEYNPIILTRFAYPPIGPWEDEGISREVCHQNLIGYYPTTEQITIPHFDIDGRFIGLRGRCLAKDDAERFGKYRPLLVGKNLYNHPLSANLYHLNKSKDNIARVKAAVIFEGEKSALKYQTFYGNDNDISVACCGSSLSSFQIELLRELGVREIILAFDRQFQKIGDDEFHRLTKKLVATNNKYKQFVKISAIFDKEMITGYKSSPIDCGRDVFEYLLKRRIIF